MMDATRKDEKQHRPFPDWLRQPAQPRPAC